MTVSARKALVRLEKIDASINPQVRSAHWNQWLHGLVNEGLSLPVAYTLKGYLLTRIRIGERFAILRIERNGIRVIGCFYSTPIVALQKELIETQNSIYQLTICSDTAGRSS